MLDKTRLFAGFGWLAAIFLLASCSPAPETPIAEPDPQLPESLLDRCMTLGGERVNDSVTITDAELIEPTDRHPEFCKATAAFDNSELRFAVWLPVADWNGRLAFIGGGGFDGMLMDEEFMLIFSPSVLEDGYAIVTTNGGYDGPGRLNPVGYFAAEFALDPDKRADFMYRSEHRTLPFAESLITAFYKREPSHRYFAGCSMGGHDAMLLSQRHPDDFDGIVARSPAGNVVALMRAFNRIGAFIRNNEIEFDGAEKQLLADAVLAQCDAKDGLKDGIIARPQTCDFHPSTLQCPTDGDKTCLTDKQVALVELVTSPINSADGDIIHPGYWHGGEAHDKGWGEYVYPKMLGYSIGMLFSQGFVRSFVTGDADFDTSQWDPADWQTELAELEAQFDAFNPDLSEFHDSGGKLLLWTGTLDTSVAPADTIRYYESVVDTLGVEAAAETVELIVAPGVGHCFGGVGPDRIDLVDALKTWVEDGTPPSAQDLLHTQQDEDGDTLMSRPACVYPSYARYRGEGDPAKASSFFCAPPADAPNSDGG